MAYKFQSGLAKLAGTISTSGELQVSGSDPKFADKSLEVADLDVSNGSALGNNVATADVMIIADAGDSNNVKKVTVEELQQIMTGSATVDIDALTELDAAPHATEDEFVVSDDGTEKRVSMTNVAAGVFALVTGGDATIASNGALTIAADSVENSMLANITRGSIKVGGAANAPTDLDAKTSGQILVGDGTDIASVAVSGDAALAANGALTIANDAVTNAKLANITRGSIKVGGNSNAPTDLDAKTSGQILVGDGTDLASVAVSGDATLAANGALSLAAAQTNVTSLLAADIKIGEDDQTKIDFADPNQINFHANNAKVLELSTANSGDAVLNVGVADKNFTVKGTDGSSAITALDIDMAAAGNATFNGSVTAGSSFIIGSADMNEADLEKIDGITAGTVLASKAIVVDGNKDATGIRSLTGSGNVMFAGGDFSGDLNIGGDVNIAGAFNRVTTNVTELAVEDKRIIVGSGSKAADIDGGGFFFGGEQAEGLALAEIAYNHEAAGEDELIFAFSGSNVMKIDAGADLALLADGAVISLGVNSDVALTHVHNKGLLLGGTGDIEIQLRDDAIKVASSGDGYLDLSADEGINLSASYIGVAGSVTASGGLQAKDVHSTGYMRLHLDSVGYVDQGQTQADATNTNGLLAFVSGTDLSPRAVQLSGAILAGDFPSYVSVQVTGSDTAVFLQLPVSGTDANSLGARDAGKVITIKKTAHVADTVDLVLTGTAEVADGGLFEGSLAAITMSSPDAAVNLMWNGAYYELF